MYIRDAFKQHDINAIVDCVKDNSLALLVVNGEPFPQVFHVPLLLIQEDEKWLLKGHVALANPLVTLDKTPILAVFNGADAYISPGFYATKQQDPRVVPTWNYATVQMGGQLELKHDLDWKLALLTQLTQTHEGKREQPWQITDAPADYIEKMTKAIVGIEIEVEDIKGKWKVSQNQPQENKQSVANHLEATSVEENVTMAAMVKQFF